MSTRCMIHFHQGNCEKPDAIIYRHSDGYPDTEHGVPANLERFFSDVEAQTDDTRFGDAEYLAAKFVVWQAHENAAGYKYNVASGEFTEHPKAMLNFLGVGVAMQDHGDIEYCYHVWCDGKRPVVTWEKAPFGNVA